ncbi:MAG: tetratricopeptide repeat protein [Candidatus Eremiobacteraeota bacterium]|nr:tetratricopeptide repeat protein [Candidatus Eremiobacteraeota bacterium]
MRRSIFLLVLLSFPVLACLNLTEKNLDGKDVRVDAPLTIEPELSFETVDWKSKLARLDERLSIINPNTEVGRESRNDRGVCLAHLGRAKEALSLFQKLEQEEPGTYRTAANLGTCYELCGQDQEALHWIQVGMKLFPQSHEGTEWLHVKILQAKIAIAKDPDWLKSHSVLGYDFGPELRPQFPKELADQASRERVRKALRYQLQERIPLVGPPDPVVGDLLFDLANLCALMTTAHRGEVVMIDSLRYHPPRFELAKKRRDYFASFDKEEEVSANWIQPAVAVLALLGLLHLLIRRRHRVPSNHWPQT